MPSQQLAVVLLLGLCLALRSTAQSVSSDGIGAGTAAAASQPSVGIPTKVFPWQQYGGDAAHASNSHLALAFPGACTAVFPVVALVQILH